MQKTLAESDFQLIWYLNVTASQIIELIENGNNDLAISFLKNAKAQIKGLHPECCQVSELESE